MTAPAPAPTLRLSDDAVAGTVVSITFQNPLTHFVVCRIAREDDPTLTTAVKGELPGLQVGTTARFLGRWTERRSVGRWEKDREGEPQFHATRLETRLPVTSDGIIAYITHGKTFKGLGPKRAEALVARFGVHTLTLLHADPQRVTEVFGAGKTRDVAVAAFTMDVKGRAHADMLVRLQSHGFRAHQAEKIIERFGLAKTDEIVRLTPYEITKVRGIGFTTADTMALQMGMHPNDPARLTAGAVHAVETLMQQGDSATTQDQLETAMASLLRPASVDGEVPVALEPAALRTAIHDAILRERLVEDLGLLYTPDAHQHEVSVAAHVARARLATVTVTAAHESVLASVLTTSGLSPEQREAVDRALRAPVSVLTGGPGTGKTTTLKTLTAILTQMGKRIALAAPTGKAAMRAQEVTGMSASTIHRLLGGFRANPHGPCQPLAEDVVIIDEMSMVDVALADWVLASIDFRTTQLILVGDVDQIPSVGHGEVFANLIDSGAIPVSRLTTIFRQAASSRIVTNAHAIIQGRSPELAAPLDAAGRPSPTDFHFRDIQVHEFDDAGTYRAVAPGDRSALECEKAQHILLTAIQKYFVERLKADPLRDIQVLAPMKAGGLGIHRLNTLLQEALNPLGAPGPMLQAEYVSRVGDRVIATKNNRHTGIMNGEMAVITAVGPKRVVLDFSVFSAEKGEVVYEGAALKEIAPAWALTVHRTQGSEFKYVIACWHTSHFTMLKRRLLYTMVTRAKQELVLLSTHRAIELTMAGSLGDSVRCTGLTRRLQALVESTGRALPVHGRLGAAA